MGRKAFKHRNGAKPMREIARSHNGNAGTIVRPEARAHGP